MQEDRNKPKSHRGGKKKQGDRESKGGKERIGAHSSEIKPQSLQFKEDITTHSSDGGNS